MPFLQGVKNNLHIWNPRPRFAYSLSNFYWATTTIKGRLLSSRPMLKPFSGEKIPSPVEMWAQNGSFLGKMGVETLGCQSTEGTVYAIPECRQSQAAATAEVMRICSASRRCIDVSPLSQ